MCVDVWTGGVEKEMCWELESRSAVRIAVPLKKFNIAELGSGEVRWCVESEL